MINTKTLDGSFVKRSKPACVDHIVNWESSATVRVTLSKNAGSLPVEGTLIAWGEICSFTRLSGTDVADLPFLPCLQNWCMLTAMVKRQGCSIIQLKPPRTGS